MASSAIGDFVIGISPIGVNGNVNGVPTIISQYANSPALLSILNSIGAAIDCTRQIQEFYDLVWNVQSAQGWGLDVWGRIVGVGRVLAVPQGEFLGFEEAGHAGANSFGFAPLYSGSAITQNYALSDNAYRLLIMAKAAANIWDGSVPGLNNILRLLFPGQVCYVVDGQDMTMTYTFAFTLTPVQFAVIATSGVLPRPCGVAANVVQL